MQRAVFVQYRHLVRRKHLRGHSRHRDFLPVLPELRARIRQCIRGILVHLSQPDDALHLHRVFRDEFAVGHEVVAVDADGHGKRGLDRVAVVISGDIRREILQQRGLVAMGRFRERADDGLYLIRRERRQIHILRFEILCYHGRDVAGRKRRGQRAACDLLICQYKGGQAVRSQAAGVHIVLFQII